MVRETEDGGSALRFAVAVAVVAGLALTVRVLLVVLVTQHRNLGFDSDYYDMVARELREGRGFQDPFALYFGNRVVPTALFPPGFPVVVSTLGRVHAATHLTHLLVPCVLGTGTVVGVMVLARRLGGIRTAVIAGLLAAVHPMLIGPDIALMTESLYALIVVGVVLLTYAMLDQGPRMSIVIAAGSLVGAAALTRGEGALLLALPVAALWLISTGLRRVGLVVVVLTLAGAMQLPWAIRNYLAFGELLAGSNNTSTVIGGSNCDATYHGDHIGFWEYDCLRTERPGWDRMSDTALNDQIRQDGLSYARDHLGRAPVVGGVRVLRTWGFFDPIDQMRWETGEGRVFWLQVLGWVLDLVLFPLAVIGGWHLRRSGRHVWPLVAVAVIVSFTSLATYGNQRFRIAAEPAIVVAAAVTMGSRGWLHDPSRAEVLTRRPQRRTLDRGSRFSRRGRPSSGRCPAPR